MKTTNEWVDEIQKTLMEDGFPDFQMKSGKPFSQYVAEKIISECSRHDKERTAEVVEMVNDYLSSNITCYQDNSRLQRHICDDVECGVAQKLHIFLATLCLQNCCCADRDSDKDNCRLHYPNTTLRSPEGGEEKT